MEHLNFKKICRICMNEGTTMSLFKVSMFKKMMAIASVQVWPNDGLPGQICRRCASKLHIAFQLKKQCEKTDLKLRQFKSSIPNDKKIFEPVQANIDLVEEGLSQQINVQAVTQKVFIQNNEADLIENLKPPDLNYDHFMTMASNGEPISQVSYTSLSTMEGEIHVPGYNVQGHMIYAPQYNIQTQHLNTQPQIQQSQIIPLEVETQLPIQTKEKTENIDSIEKSIENVDERDGKACPTCGKIFRTNVKLNRHMKIHTTSPTEFPFKCNICGKAFAHGGNYKMHLRIHSNERPFKCPVCEKGCRQAQDLEKHMRTHTGERPHKCGFCPKAFATSSNLTAHIRIHTGERPYVCCVCQKAFCQSSELTKHMRTHTGEKSHICDICQKGFNGSSGLLTHRRQHTGERPYTCPHCSRGFASSNCLSSHIKTHNKAYPLKCGQCDQTFQSLSSLKEHMTADHNVAELIQCKMCDSSFERVNDYFTHMRTHEEMIN
ncbi:zinc finger protein 501-like [Euwallacea similis]|uniref:zinc finger protein 501-like n=1 Tax=Euwallacea similis TaxID=1736056 RepID=UPI00344E3762